MTKIFLRSFIRIFVLGLICTVVCLQFYFPQRPAVDSVVFGFNEGKPTVDPDILKVITFGYDRAVTAILWVRFLQNTPPMKAPKDSPSWIYYDLETISSLDPEFRPTYRMGALFLSVITEDTLGAQKILERGAKLFPGDYKILGALGYHYLIEMKQAELAGPVFLQAAKLDGAPYIYSILAANYLKKSSSAGAAVSLLKSMIPTTNNPAVIKRLEDKIHQLESQGAQK